MGLIYALIAFYQYGLPLLILVMSFFVLRRVLKGRWWRNLFAGIAVLLFAASPTLLAKLQIEQDIAKFAPEEIRPANLDLPPGALILVQPGNHAGLSCGWPCDALTEAAFVSDLHREYGEYLVAPANSDPLGVHDLWEGLRHAKGLQTIDRSGPFPYQYAFISTEAWRYPDAQEGDTYRMAHWPRNAKGLHILATIPPSGILDFANGVEVHYRRFSIQDELKPFPFLGFAGETIQKPSVAEVMQDLVSLSRSN